tara:strand:+ start:685 stop:876 length:192 start_codon:yes stop_codon:yes gene_type:complete
MKDNENDLSNKVNDSLTNLVNKIEKMILDLRNKKDFEINNTEIIKLLDESKKKLDMISLNEEE